MRDIRNDLKERLAALAKDKVLFQTRITETEQAEASIKALLEREEQRFMTTATHAHSNGNDATIGKTPLSRFIVDALQHSKEALTLFEFKKRAETKLEFNGHSPGRTLHRALLGLTHNGYLTCHGKGSSRRYSLRQK
jgi:hypothetical protein